MLSQSLGLRPDAKSDDEVLDVYSKYSQWKIQDSIKCINAVQVEM